MRNFHKLPEPGVTGTPVAAGEGAGPSHMMTITPNGVQLEPVFPHYEDLDGGEKEQYRVHRAARSDPGQLARVGRP